MVADAASLPREPDILIGMIVELRDENSRLLAMLETMRRTLYGARSEKLDSGMAQLPLDLPDVSTAPVELTTTTKPVIRGLVDPAEGGAQYRRFAQAPPARGCRHRARHQDMSLLPGQFASHWRGCQRDVGRRTRRHQGQADPAAALWLPSLRRPRGASSGTGAPRRRWPADDGVTRPCCRVKFAWHLPLHRQVQMLAGLGITLDRSTLVHWIERAAWWLRPLHSLLLETVMSAPKVFCDDTPLPVLDRTRRRTRIGRLWCYAVDDRPWQGPTQPAVVYLYAPDRRGRHMREHLVGFHGVLQVDGYNGYDKLALPTRPGGAITLAYCLAHARREFFDEHKKTSRRGGRRSAPPHR